MSYKIGQFRRSSNIDDYYIDGGISNTPKVIESFFQEKSNDLTSEVFFENAYQSISVNKQNYYYLNFSVKKMNSKQTFYLKLKNFVSSEEILSENNEQIIAEYTVSESKIEDEWENFEVIIAPNKSYEAIYWDLQRSVSNDYLAASDIQLQGAIGRKMTVRINQFSIIKNIIKDIDKIIKIGVQGPPALLMCINGEQIRIGKTGIFEINQDNVSISFVGFVPKIKNNIIDYFIMDYEYYG